MSTNVVTSQNGTSTGTTGSWRPAIADTVTSLRPLTAASVTMGVPIAPQATGAVFASRFSTADWKGEKPSPTMTAPAIATGVPNPDVPSMIAASCPRGAAGAVRDEPRSALTDSHDVELLPLDRDGLQHGDVGREPAPEVAPGLRIDQGHRVVRAGEIVAHLVDVEHPIELPPEVEVDREQEARGEEPYLATRGVAPQRGGHDPEVLGPLDHLVAHARPQAQEDRHHRCPAVDHQRRTTAGEPHEEHAAEDERSEHQNRRLPRKAGELQDSGLLHVGHERRRRDAHEHTDEEEPSDRASGPGHDPGALVRPGADDDRRERTHGEEVDRVPVAREHDRAERDGEEQQGPAGSGIAARPPHVGQSERHQRAPRQELDDPVEQELADPPRQRQAEVPRQPIPPEDGLAEAAGSADRYGTSQASVIAAKTPSPTGLRSRLRLRHPCSDQSQATATSRGSSPTGPLEKTAKATAA